MNHDLLDNIFWSLPKEQAQLPWSTLRTICGNRCELTTES